MDQEIKLKIINISEEMIYFLCTYYIELENKEKITF